MTAPDRATLRAWQRRWHAIQVAAHAELVASYTPEQRAIIARRTHAISQSRLCARRIRFPDGRDGGSANKVAWPDEPPTSDN